MTDDAPAEGIPAPGPGWRELDDPKGDGLVVYRLDSWSKYFDFMEVEVFTRLRRRSYIWRGQRRADWSLSTSLDRLLSRLELLDRPDLDAIARDQLESFQDATRGRRGQTAPVLENDWWALGQHYGLATPLLDWCRSPFAAAYFAFEDESANSTDFRVVFGLDERATRARSDEIIESASLEQGRAEVVEFIDAMTDENPRLVSQGGLFTRAPIGTPIERWIANEFEGISEPILIRIEIPNADRLRCLRALNRMNINHLSLFPDLSGASRFTNLRLELENPS